jgi:hypothetical protein
MGRPGSLTGAAGVYHVASCLAFRGLHASLTIGNAPFVDLLVSSPDGRASLALQVKTAAWAERTRGRGEAKVLHHFEWDVGEKSAKHAQPGLFYAFVDLRDLEAMPSVFILPSEAIAGWFRPLGELKRWRYHPLEAELAPYRDRWDLLENYLISQHPVT